MLKIEFLDCVMIFTQGTQKNIAQIEKKYDKEQINPPDLLLNPMFCCFLKDYYLHKNLWAADFLHKIVAFRKK